MVFPLPPQFLTIPPIATVTNTHFPCSPYMMLELFSNSCGLSHKNILVISDNKQRLQYEFHQRRVSQDKGNGLVLPLAIPNLLHSQLTLVKSQKCFYILVVPLQVGITGFPLPHRGVKRLSISVIYHWNTHYKPVVKSYSCHFNFGFENCSPLIKFSAHF